MNILGCDPAAKFGWAHSCGQHGVWSITDKADKHPGRRLERLRVRLFEVKRQYGIDVLASEDASFGSTNPSVQALHNELRGMLKLAAAEWDIPVLLFKPSALKKWLTGSGNADKQTMIRFVESVFGVVTRDDNVADAVAVMEMAKKMVLNKELVA
jgi:crossover junction endodeoxyribonuclease RuvC